MEFLLAASVALWLGILTSISPCPLATNIAAISFVSYRVCHKGIVLLSGILYTLGRSITYTVIGYLVVNALVNIPLLSDFLMRYINKILGVLLIAVGIYLLDLVRIKLPGIAPSEKIQKKLDNAGVVGSLLLGVLFALAFCPVAAALFFGSLIPLAVSAKSSFALPLIYGVGTGLPVLGFAILVIVGAEVVNRVYSQLTRFEFWTRKITGVIFILVGVYYVLAYIFGINILGG